MRTLVLGLLATSTLSLTACHTAATTGTDATVGAAAGGDRLDTRGHTTLRRDVDRLTTRAFDAVGRALGGDARVERLESQPCGSDGVRLLRRGSASDDGATRPVRDRSRAVSRAWTAAGLHPGVQRDRLLDGDLAVAGDDVLGEARHGLEGGVRVRLLATPPTTGGSGVADTWTLEARTACLPVTPGLARALGRRGRPLRTRSAPRSAPAGRPCRGCCAGWPA